MQKLTPREEEILNFIKDYMRKNGATPTMGEIGRGTYISEYGAYKMFCVLVRKGYIHKISGKRYSVKGMIYVDGKTGT